jgi:branched-chain amino acid transport system substrate-binding protein
VIRFFDVMFFHNNFERGGSKKMKRSRVKLLSVSLCLVLAVMLALPAYAPAAGKGKPLKIGLLLPYTGFDPRNAKGMEAATRLKLDEIGWKVGGRTIELLTEDSATDPKTGVERARKLVEKDQVDVILGALFGNVVVAVAAYAKKAGVCYAPIVQQSMAALRTSPNNVVLPTGTLAGSTYPTGLYAYDERGYRTATILYSDYIAGEEFIGGFVEGFQSRGGTIIQRQPVPLGTVDFAPYLTNLKKADVMAFWYAGTMGPFLRQYYQFGVDLPVVAVTYWTIEPKIMNELGDKALGVIGGGHASTEIPTPLNLKFIDSLQKKFGISSPTHHMYSAYIVTGTFLEAVKGTEGDTSPEKLIEAWRSVKMETPMGVVSFDEKGCGIGDLYVFVFSKEGERYYWKVVKEYKQIRMKAPSE